MTKHKRHDDNALLRRIRDEAPELLEAEIAVDLDETFKALIDADPNSRHLSPKRRKRKRRTQSRLTKDKARQT